MIGQVFGRLTVKSELPRLRKYERRWLCQCSCGNTKEVIQNNLKNGSTASCGCIKTEMLLARNAAMSTHNMTKTSEYLAWTNIHRRCEDPKDVAYARYGGLGVAVCERWNTFENFIADMGLKPSKAHSIERRDNTKGYSPDNCHWATQKEQSRNKSSNVMVMFEGKEMVLRDACEKAGVNYFTVWSRIDRGWEAEYLFKPEGFKPPKQELKFVVKHYGVEE